MLGGMSWESSAEYYRLVNELVRERLGGLHSARCVLASLDFAEVERLQVAGEWAQAGELPADAARGLEAAGAELLLICTKTVHEVADQVQAAVGIPLLHLADATAEAVISAGLDTVGLLGTAFTMERPFYRDRLAGHGLRVLGCTEIELMIGQADSPVPVFPTTRLHAEAAVTAALADQPVG